MLVLIQFPWCCYSLLVSAIFYHFGYPSLQLDQWQQCTWYDLGAAQYLLHQMRNCLLWGLPAIASPPRAEPALSIYMPASALSHPVPGGKFVKASQSGNATNGVTAAGASSTSVALPPKTEAKRKKKKLKTPKCTVTSETVSLPETMKKKVISESPDSEAEGSFRDSNHTESAPENSPHTTQ